MDVQKNLSKPFRNFHFSFDFFHFLFDFVQFLSVFISFFGVRGTPYSIVPAEKPGPKRKEDN